MNKQLAIVVIAILVTIASTVPILIQKSQFTNNDDEVAFKIFKTKHGKVYDDEHDETFRKHVFLTNLGMIRKHNVEYENGKHTYTLKMNKFGDLTPEEFKAGRSGFKLKDMFPNQRTTAVITATNNNNNRFVAPPASIDWTKKGAVTPVQDEGQCGSTFSFSATGSMEGAWFIKTGQLIKLSDQQVMDCSKDEGNQSCEGGLMTYVFDYVLKNKGLCSVADYPYKGVDRDECDASKCKNVAHITSYVNISTTTTALTQAVAQVPTAVAVEADQTAFQFYSTGVLTGTCGNQLDHAMTVVGYGEMNGVEYWKCKNMWGTSWGMEGYILIEKGSQESSGGQCGILLANSYAVV